MKTQIIISDKWKLIEEYNFMITLTEGDIVEYDDKEYAVTACILNIDKNLIQILIEN
jgi:hypothetical protein